jgi:hypothetical protein
MNRERRCSLTKHAWIFLYRNFRRPIKPSPYSAFPGWPAMSEPAKAEAESNGWGLVDSQLILFIL